MYCKNIYLHNRELLAGIPPLEGLPGLDPLTTRVTQIKADFWPAVVSCTQVDANVITIFQMNPNWYFHKIWITVKYVSTKWEHVILADIVREIDSYWSAFASRFTLMKFFIGVDLRHRSYEAISHFWIYRRVSARKRNPSALAVGYVFLALNHIYWMLNCDIVEKNQMSVLVNTIYDWDTTVSSSIMQHLRLLSYNDIMGIWYCVYVWFRTNGRLNQDHCTWSTYSWFFIQKLKRTHNIICASQKCDVCNGQINLSCTTYRELPAE